jgi:hypothetical protein
METFFIKNLDFPLYRFPLTSALEDISALDLNKALQSRSLHGDGTILLGVGNYLTTLHGSFTETEDGLTGTISSILVQTYIPGQEPSDFTTEAPDGSSLFFPTDEILNAPLTALVIIYRTPDITLSLDDYLEALRLNTPHHDGYDPDAARALIEPRIFAGNDSFYIEHDPLLGDADLTINAFDGDDDILLLDRMNNASVAAGNGNDTVRSIEPGQDYIDGGPGDDFLIVGSGDTVSGGLGNDYISTPLTVGDDALSGPDAAATATVVYDTGIDKAKITFDAPAGFAGRWSVSDVDGSSFGTDEIRGNPALVFADREWSSTDVISFLDLQESDITRLVELYIAHFDRAPDALGLHFWGARLQEGMTLHDISAEFYASPESALSRPDGMTNAEYITDIYQNVLGRAPDAGGLAFWERILDSEVMSVSSFVVEFLQGVRNLPENPTGEQLFQYVEDSTYLTMKTDIGVYFSMIHGLNNVAQAGLVMSASDRSAVNSFTPKELTDTFALEAMEPDTGSFVVKVLGVIDDPYAPIEIILA